MFDLLRAEIKRTWTIYWRYPMDFVSGLVIMFVTFYALIAGTRYIAGPAVQFGDRLDGLILGYWLWNLAVFAFSYTATAVRMEAVTGTLEQIYLSPHSTLRVFMIRSVASLGINLSTSTLLLVILLLLTGRRFSFPLTALVPLATALMASYGIGLLISGLTLLVKQVAQFLTIVQFLLLAVVLVPFETWDADTLVALIPIAPSAGLLRDLMTRQAEPELLAFLLAGGNGVIFLTLGMLLFGLADRQARVRGIVGQY